MEINDINRTDFAIATGGAGVLTGLSTFIISVPPLLILLFFFYWVLVMLFRKR